jgi:hypothetical protein
MWICESTISIAFSPDLGFNRGTMIGFARGINHSGRRSSGDDRRQADRPQPSAAVDGGGGPRVKKADIDLPEELLRQFIAAWPAYEAMVRRIPRRRGYAEEPAHSYRPGRMVRG